MPSNSEKLATIELKDGLPTNPLGFYILVELVEVEQISAGGIYIGNQKREQQAEECGYVRAIGPTSYHGWEGCTPYGGATEHYTMWGIDIGDLVEFRAYEGKKCVIPGYDRWRYIPDSHIVGVINEKSKE